MVRGVALSKKTIKNTLIIIIMMGLRVLSPVFPIEGWSELSEHDKHKLVSKNLIKVKQDEQKRNKKIIDRNK